MLEDSTKLKNRVLVNRVKIKGIMDIDFFFFLNSCLFVLQLS